MIRYLDETGKLSPDYKQTLPADLAIKGYKTMLLTRLLDERMITLQRQGMITFAMSALGEEACAVASAAALESGDWIVIRNIAKWGALLARLHDSRVCASDVWRRSRPDPGASDAQPFWIEAAQCRHRLFPHRD